MSEITRYLFCSHSARASKGAHQHAGFFIFLFCFEVDLVSKSFLYFFIYSLAIPPPSQPRTRCPRDWSSTPPSPCAPLQILKARLPVKRLLARGVEKYIPQGGGHRPCVERFELCNCLCVCREIISSLVLMFSLCGIAIYWYFSLAPCTVSIQPQLSPPIAFTPKEKSAALKGYHLKKEER